MSTHFRTPAAASMATTEWSMEFDFEEIEIEEDGIHFGSFWGTAELALNDPANRDFYVKHIAINGQKRERQMRGGYELSFIKRTNAVLLLPRPAKDDRTFKAHLFRAIEKALYASSEAAERFAREMEIA